MRTADFQFDLPPELIAQTPPPVRDASRLLVLNRTTRKVDHRGFSDLTDYLHPGDVLVLNNSRVIPARLRAKNSRSGGRFEILLLKENAANDWWCLVHPGKRARIGTEMTLASNPPLKTPVTATVLERNDQGHRRLAFAGIPDLRNDLDTLGEMPLPHYIHRAEGPTAQDLHRYQTVFAQPPGSVAAPTAGLHFTEALLERLKSRGVRVCFVTLHVGLGTFAPVKSETVEGHAMHEERYELGPESVGEIHRALEAGARVIAVGTTTVRVLESVAAANGGRLAPGAGSTSIFIFPPCRFQIVSAMLTNFHVPCSTLLMLVSAFAAPGETRGRELILSSYAEAIQQRYRFFSYGDAMLIL